MIGYLEEHFKPCLFVVGILLLILASIMLIPWIFGLFHEDPCTLCFGISVLITGFTGLLLLSAYWPDDVTHFSLKTAFFFTATAWLTLTFFAALPFAFASCIPDFTSAVLESVSALTTTGFSTFQEFSKTPPSLLIWRGLLQWLGGIGVTIMALTLFPFLSLGGMQIFATESNSYEKALPKFSQISTLIVNLYTVLSVICVLLLWFAGMNFLEAFCYGMGAISTSGMTMVNGGINHLHNPFIAWILIIFMILSASPLLLLGRFFQGAVHMYTKDSQVRTYMAFLLIAFLLILTSFFLTQHHISFFDIRKLFFHTCSMLTTSGFHYYTKHEWHPFIEILFLTLATIGGCTGSTASGIKIFRFQILYRTLRAHIYKMIMPHGIFLPVYNKKTVTTEAIYAVITLTFLYFIHLALFGGAFVFTGLPITHSFELSINVLSNSGVHFFDLDLTNLATSTKWLMSCGMLLGRLEFMTLLILLVPFFWRR